MRYCKFDNEQPQSAYSTTAVLICSLSFFEFYLTLEDQLCAMRNTAKRVFQSELILTLAPTGVWANFAPTGVGRISPPPPRDLLNYVT